MRTTPISRWVTLDSPPTGPGVFPWVLRAAAPRPRAVPRRHDHDPHLPHPRSRSRPAWPRPRRGSASPLPVVAGVRLTAARPSLTITATDLEIALETRLDAEIDEPGEIALPARLLAEIAGTLPETRVLISTHGDTATIVSGSTRFELATVPASDFPAPPDPSPTARAHISGPTLCHLLRSTLYATATDETRPALTGVSVEIDGPLVCMAATDGARLAVCSTVLEQPAPTPFTGLIPRRACAEALRILGPATPTTVSLSWNGAYVFLETSPWRLCARLLAGPFPAYQNVLGQVQHPSPVVTVDRKALMAALHRVSLASAGGAVTLSPSAHALPLSASAPGVGSAAETVDAEVTGSPEPVTFNARFVLAALKAMPAPRVRIGLTGPTSPTVVTPDGETELLCVLAPVRPSA